MEFALAVIFAGLAVAGLLLAGALLMTSARRPRRHPGSVLGECGATGAPVDDQVAALAHENLLALPRPSGWRGSPRRRSAPRGTAKVVVAIAPRVSSLWGFRLLGILGGLSVATDLGTGAPLDESMRRCLVACRLARSVGCSDEQVRTVIYASLLQHIGCTAASVEAADIVGDDSEVTRLALLTDFTRRGEVMRRFVPGVAQAGGRSRARVMLAAITARRFDGAAPTATCEVAREAARRLGPPAPVQESLGAVTASWSGAGHPRVGGDDIPLATRILHVASVGVMFGVGGGARSAPEAVAQRSGTFLDPVLATAFSAELLVTSTRSMRRRRCWAPNRNRSGRSTPTSWSQWPEPLGIWWI